MSTLATFRTAVAGELGLDNSTSGDQTQIDKWINEGVIDVVGRTACSVTSTTFSLSAGTSDYTNAVSAAMKFLNVYTTSSATQYPVERVDVETLLQMREAGSGYSSPAQYYAYAGSNLFMVYPTPAVAASATNPDSITVYYVPYPATLSVSSDTPSTIPTEFHPAIEYYALYRGASYSDDATSQMGQSYLARYEMWIKQMKRDTGLAGGRKAARARVVDGRGVPYHDRSRYPGN